MSMKKLALGAAALALVTAVQVETAASSTKRCPPPRPFNGGCIDVIAFATDPQTGQCCQYPNPCSAPEGWTISYTGCPTAS